MWLPYGQTKQPVTGNAKPRNRPIHKRNCDLWQRFISSVEIGKTKTRYLNRRDLKWEKRDIKTTEGLEGHRFGTQACFWLYNECTASTIQKFRTLLLRSQPSSITALRSQPSSITALRLVTGVGILSPPGSWKAYLPKSVAPLLLFLGINGLYLSFLNLCRCISLIASKP